MPCASHAVSLFLRRSHDGKEKTEIRYEWDAQTLVLDRRHSSLNLLVRRDLLSANYKTLAPETINLRIFLDQSVMEVFVDGRASFAARIYPTLAETDGLAAQSFGGAGSIESLRVHRIQLPAARPPDLVGGKYRVFRRSPGE